MKKIFLLLVMAVCLVNYSFSQTQTTKGKIMVGLSSGINVFGEGFSTGSNLMSIGFTSMKVKSNADGFEEPDPDKVTSFNLLPAVGYFVMDNLAVGLDLTLSSNTEKEGGDSDSKYKSNLFLGGPFVRYYFPVNNLFPFVSANVGFGSAKNTWEEDGESDENKSGLTSFGLGAGLAVPLGDKVTFDLMAGYNSIASKSKEDNPDDVRYVLSSFGIKFGFVIYFGGE